MRIFRANYILVIIVTQRPRIYMASSLAPNVTQAIDHVSDVGLNQIRLDFTVNTVRYFSKN